MSAIYSTINLKPLSVNEAWQGQRFKTDKYKKYEKDLLFILPNKKLTIKAPYNINILLFMSNKRSDIDNPVKLIIDILQKKYLFNDCDIYQLLITKTIVKKGKEGFHFIIYNEDKTSELIALNK